MSTAITLGKAHLFTISLVNDNGATGQVATNQPGSVKVRMNPDNPREFGVLALAPTGGADVTVTCAGMFATTTITVSAANPPPSMLAITPSGAEIDAPGWLAA
jgi:hypothetical protein